MAGARSALRESGFVWIQSELNTPGAAFAKSQELIGECTASSGHEPLSVIGEVILPPPDGEATRDFQTLHFDFGVPLRPLRDQDVALLRGQPGTPSRGRGRVLQSLGLDVEAVQVEVPLRPGDLLVFDSLAVAHGRRGSRAPGELHRRVYGHRSLPSAAQCALRDRFLAVFGELQQAPPRPAVSVP